MGQHKSTSEKRPKGKAWRDSIGSRHIRFRPIPNSQRADKREKPRRGFGLHVDRIQIINTTKEVEITIPETEMVPNRNGHLNPRIVRDKNGNIKRYTVTLPVMIRKMIKHFQSRGQ